MEKEISQFIMLLAGYSVLVPLIFSFKRVKNGSYEQRNLSILMIISALIEFGSLFLAKILKLPNLPLLHLITVLEFAIIIQIFKPSLKNYFSPKQLNGLIIVFSIFSILNSTFYESIFKFNPTARVIESLIVMSIILLYLYDILVSLKVKYLEKTPVFWISAGLLFYFSSTLLINSYSNILFGGSKISYLLWGFHGIVLIISYIFYTIALWINSKL